MNATENKDLQTKSDNSWAWGIVIVFLLFSALIVLTLKIAMLDYPVEMDNHFRKDYHFVDANINDLLRMSAQFDERGFKLQLPKQLKLGTNSLSFVLQDSNAEAVSGASLNLLITREATTKDDIVAGKLVFHDGKYHSEAIEILSPGIWILNVEITIADLRLIRKAYLAIPLPENLRHKDAKSVNAHTRKAETKNKNALQDRNN
ncbi:MAG: FixH family protein [SAR324 cluster bacterium]|nr:FixH family protein [SAR324 cluster bacterium]MBL7034795.1 FixH family protein [SAR324 cluster bacterium]